jgi:hypothetical protein
MRVLTLSIALLIGGCTSSRDSYLEFVCPVGRPGYVHVALTTPTGEWAFNGHALLHQPIRLYSLRLPASPADPARYSFEELRLIDQTVDPEVDVPLRGGNVDLSVARGTFSMQLQTESGDFWANGKYPFRSLQPRLSSRPPQTMASVCPRRAG